MCLSPNVLGISHHEGGGHKNHIWTTTLPPTLAAWQRKPVQVTNYIQSPISRRPSRPITTITFHHLFHLFPISWRWHPRAGNTPRSRRGRPRLVLHVLHVIFHPFHPFHVLTVCQAASREVETKLKVVEFSTSVSFCPQVLVWRCILHMKIPVQCGWTLCCFSTLFAPVSFTWFYSCPAQLWSCFHHKVKTRERHLKVTPLLTFEGETCGRKKRQKSRENAGSKSTSLQVLATSTAKHTRCNMVTHRCREDGTSSELKKTYWKQTRKHAEIYKLRKAACHIHMPRSMPANASPSYALML